jgi:hypothetical protein
MVLSGVWNGTTTPTFSLCRIVVIPPMSRGPSWPLTPLGRNRLDILDTATSVMAVTGIL